MKKYHVQLKSLVLYTDIYRVVEAEDETEAIEKAKDGSREYSLVHIQELREGEDYVSQDKNGRPPHGL